MTGKNARLDEGRIFDDFQNEALARHMTCHYFRRVRARVIFARIFQAARAQAQPSRAN